MKLNFAGLALMASIAAGCASAPAQPRGSVPAKIYVINDTGQALSGGIRDLVKISLTADVGMQEVRGFPDRAWWLIAGSCVYRYPGIAVGDPAWLRLKASADASGARDLLVRVTETFTVRAFTYARREGAMVADEIKVAGLPMTPQQSCSAN